MLYYIFCVTAYQLLNSQRVPHRKVTNKTCPYALQIKPGDQKQ